MKKNLYMLIISMFIILIPIKVFASPISLNKSETLLDIGYSETLKYTLEEGLNNTDIIWTSSNESVATVKDGKVTAISEGTTTITASINGNKSTCTVVVSSDYIPVSGISINQSSLTILIGSTTTLTANITPSNATYQEITWTSSNETVATVKDGKVTGISEGTTTITASIDGKKSTCTIKVADTIPLEEITINKTSLTIKEKSTEKLSITYSPSNATNKKITWKSSNPNIVSVDSEGNITAIKTGSATITAISDDGGYVVTCKVTVQAISKKVTSVSLDKKEVTLETGENVTLKVTINPSYAENKNVTWTSSNEAVASAEGGKIIAISPGTAEIKVISEDGNKEAICKVTVTSPPLEGISFAQVEQTLYVGDEISLIPILSPTTSVLEEPIWTSSDEIVATVENGLIRAFTEGTTTITVYSKDKKLSATTNVVVINRPQEPLNITVEGYDLNFDENVKNYTLTIKDENELKIHTNVSEDEVIINGNKNLKNGSIITITINNEEPSTYVINIKKQGNYTIYFIIIICILLLLNLVRIMIKNKKKK